MENRAGAPAITAAARATARSLDGTGGDSARFAPGNQRVNAAIAGARLAGAHTIELNLEPSVNARAFDEGRYGPATEVVEAWVADMMAKTRSA